MAGKVNIAGGELTGQADGIYYDESRNADGGLTISGGTFTGITRSGLYLNAQPRSGNYYHIRLSGGEFSGKPSRQGVWGSYYWINGAIGAPAAWGGVSGVGNQTRVGYLLETNCYAVCYYDGNSHSADNDSRLSQSTARSETVIIQKG